MVYYALLRDLYAIFLINGFEGHAYCYPPSKIFCFIRKFFNQHRKSFNMGQMIVLITKKDGKKNDKLSLSTQLIKIDRLLMRYSSTSDSIAWIMMQRRKWKVRARKSELRSR